MQESASSQAGSEQGVGRGSPVGGGRGARPTLSEETPAGDRAETLAGPGPVLAKARLPAGPLGGAHVATSTSGRDAPASSEVRAGSFESPSGNASAGREADSGGGAGGGGGAGIMSFEQAQRDAGSAVGDGELGMCRSLDQQVGLFWGTPSCRLGTPACIARFRGPTRYFCLDVITA